MKYDIYVEVLGSITNGYRMKVDINDLGVYMYGWTARRSSKNESGWWVQPGAYNVNGKWKMTVEFNKSLPLWKQLETRCLEAVAEFERTPQLTDADYTPEAINDGLDEMFGPVQPHTQGHPYEE